MFVALMKEQQRAHGGDFCAYMMMKIMMTDAVSFFIFVFLCVCRNIELTVEAFYSSY